MDLWIRSQDKEEQTKTYQKILQEQQNEIDQLERNCDVFNEQMNDAVERATELQQENEAMKQLIEWIEECDFGFDNFATDYEDEINMTEEEFDKETENMSYIESMIHYAKLYIKTNSKQERNLKYNLEITLEEFKAIQKQIEELGWESDK